MGHRLFDQQGEGLLGDFLGTQVGATGEDLDQPEGGAGFRGRKLDAFLENGVGVEGREARTDFRRYVGGRGLLRAEMCRVQAESNEGDSGKKREETHVMLQKWAGLVAPAGRESEPIQEFM